MKIYISGKITGLEPAVYSANFEKKRKRTFAFWVSSF